MTNKFSQRANKAKSPKPKIGINDLLVDYESRYLVLLADNFVPDPNQLRKAFNQEQIDELRVSIESHGELQPILVGKKLVDGKYPIIAGERRWRAIVESDIVTEVQAIIHHGDVDELHLLLMQIDENNQREQVPLMEHAMAMRRIVDICKVKGNDQAYAAKLLNISPSQLSKHLAVLEANPVLTELSVHGETQDVEVLYNLAKAAEIEPKEVSEVMNQWRSGELGTSLRKASKDLAGKAKQAKNESGNHVASGNKSQTYSKNETMIPKPKKVSSVRLGLDNDDFMLIVEMGHKKLNFRIEADDVVTLKGDIDKHWSK